MSELPTFAKLAPQIVIALVMLVVVLGSIWFGVSKLMKLIKEYGVNGQFEEHVTEDREAFQKVNNSFDSVHTKIDKNTSMIRDLHEKFIEKKAFDAGKEAGETGRHKAQA